MAGAKSPKTLVDKLKKRKRDVAENDSRSKRQRPARKDNAFSNSDRSTSENQANGEVVKVNVSSDGPSNSLSGAGLQLTQEFNNEEAGWRVSKPMGGRILDIDPILTQDEQHLILTYNTSIQVFSADDSLLVRRIPISTLGASETAGSAPATIVATRQSRQNSDFLWVACSDGRIYHVNWTKQTKALVSFQTSSRTARVMVVASVNISQAEEDVVIVGESDKPNKMDLVAYRSSTGSVLLSKSLASIKKPGNALQVLESTADGRVLVGALNDRIIIGSLMQGEVADFDQIQYDFYSFDAPDLITTLDVRVAESSAQTSGHRGKKNRLSALEKTVDIIVGGARGSIYHYQDALSKLQTAGKSSPDRSIIQGQKYHWHRRAVHAVKWSQDGNYMISGGSENVLVIWQMDTSKKDFLPHLSGSVENIVVSPTGSSYAVHLDDNSVMILSTAEMKPTAYVSGIQSATINSSTPKDSLVQRVWAAKQQVRRPIPAAIRPTDASKLHVCVGNGLQATVSGEFSAPLLQSFDLESFTSISKQALARTQPTDVNMTNKGNLIDEPLVTHIAFSADGKWLASVDDWTPPTRDIENVGGDLKDQLVRERHETYLKFWDARGHSDSFALTSRINSPHATSHTETVLDLASNPVVAGFATIGTDGLVRLWYPRPRQQGGVAVKEANGQDAFSWSCTSVIAVGDGFSQDALVEVSEAQPQTKPQASVTYSEDGSTLFAAYGGSNSGVIHVIDAASGEIIKSLEGLWSGRLQAIRALSPFLIVLSDELRVFDVVGDELRYGIVIPKIPGVTDLLQLAVDYTSGHFAVTLPVGESSSIGVFDPAEPEPVLVRSTPHRIVSLVSAQNASGFVALDDSAQIWVIAEGANPSSVTAARPLQDLNLDSIAGDAEEDGKQVALVDEDAEMASDDEALDQTGEAEDVDMEDYAHPTVLHQQHLADIFDAAPAFAAPSIEDMFYKVTGLLSTNPLATQS
ncbi:U3 small nucleolar RNA-associated protein [Paramyrothecium foliicola]|nr:U3 small nucleolar RNA-associated protein [Paramyrothecium foliicola]